MQDKRKDAVKKVIAAMTVGKDVSSLFTDVVNCMQTENLELKKLVYLYLINYAKSQPDLAILAVNTFVKVRNYSDAWHKHMRRMRFYCMVKNDLDHSQLDD
jgi:vesicle coat complex subunit